MLTNIFIIGILVILSIPVLLFLYQFTRRKLEHIIWFEDKKVQKLCYYAKHGKLKKIDKLLNDGVDINATGKKYKITPIIWLILLHKPTKKILKSLEYFLKKGADPLMVLERRDYFFNAFQLAATAKYPDYLRVLLDTYKPTKEELNFFTKGKTGPALEEASFAGNFENFKRLVDYGADIEWKDELGDSMLNLISNWLGRGWQQQYYLLQHGADYTNMGNQKYVGEEANGVYGVVLGLRNDGGGMHGSEPSYLVNQYGTDYRYKIIKFLEEKGVKVNPWMPEDEKYVVENGEDVLYIKEDGDWVKYLDSKRYPQDTKDFREPLYYKIFQWFAEL